MLLQGNSPTHKMLTCLILWLILCGFRKSQCTNPDREHNLPGRVAQWVTCLATDASLTADPGAANSIPAWSHTFVEIDREITSTVILLIWFLCTIKQLDRKNTFQVAVTYFFLIVLASLSYNADKKQSNFSSFNVGIFFSYKRTLYKLIFSD